MEDNNDVEESETEATSAPTSWTETHFAHGDAISSATYMFTEPHELEAAKSTRGEEAEVVMDLLQEVGSIIPSAIIGLIFFLSRLWMIRLIVSILKLELELFAYSRTSRGIQGGFLEVYKLRRSSRTRRSTTLEEKL